ncbi:hypothetical protein FALBO_9294 [Fusarium albosuccineum]|uniref:Uncharacterized protein n=1 Tax=Fusarium albosuccineum TaxID=1237068 RepID=A0A8H4L7V1_9HYPO|nr:hypothetical protein FALBO_9294 [Fusarium albosuccineum]
MTLKEGQELEREEEIAPGIAKPISFNPPTLQGKMYEVEVHQAVEPSARTKPQQLPETSQQFTTLVSRFLLPENAIHSTYPPQGHEEKSKEELRVPPADASGEYNIFNNIKGFQDGVQQTSTFAISGLPLSDVTKIRNTVTPITYDRDLDGDNTCADFGQRVPAGPYVYHRRYLAHERTVNTQGMDVTGAVREDEEGTFGVVISHRSGPTSIEVPVAVYVHLISIEGIEQMKPWPISRDVQYVALSSLHSWTYMCLPPRSHDGANPGMSVGMFKPGPSEEAEEKMKRDTPTGPPMLSREKEGLTLQRYRTQTGEVTGSLARGPLVPCHVKLPDEHKTISMTGENLKFLGPELGMMNITYSAAWQLGRTTAMADTAFVTALSRVRDEILNPGKKRFTETSRTAAVGYKSRTDLLKSLGELLDQVQTLNEPDPPRPQKESNMPSSPNWNVVRRWVLDRKLLVGIPSHFLISDISFLPLESIRFFQIDDVWLDTLIDGALSLGNHVSQHEDKARKIIKDSINDCLRASFPGTDTHPPVPRCGCFIRSSIVKKSPDLIVTVEATDTAAPAILVHKKILYEGFMLCLFSAAPNKSAFNGLRFTQPPHQQTFTAGHDLTDTSLTMKYRRAYTDNNRHYEDKDRHKPVSTPRWNRTKPDEKRGTGFLWEVPNSFTPSDPNPISLRVVHVENLAEDYLQQLKVGMPTGYFNDDTASSALLGYQLNEPPYTVDIDLEEDGTNWPSVGLEDGRY